MYVATTRAKHRLFVSATRRTEPTWDAVLADTDEKGRPRQKPELDHFRTMALFLRDGGVGTLLDAEDAVAPRALRATVEVAAAAVGVVELPQDGLWMRREDSPALPE